MYIVRYQAALRVSQNWDMSLAQRIRTLLEEETFPQWPHYAEQLIQWLSEAPLGV